MALPLTPPSLHKLLTEAGADGITRIISLRDDLDDQRYFHWDELRHRQAPEGYTHEHWWAALRLRRAGALRPLPFKDRNGKSFYFGMTDSVVEQLHKIDMALGGRQDSLSRLTTSEMRDRYLISSLIEESITSSQMEGASTTRQVASEMLRSGREPRTKSEWMILNNYRAMEFIRSQREDELTPAVVCELQRILTENTLDDQDDAGRLQRPGDIRVNVLDNMDGTTLHTPPAAEELPKRLSLLCDFANGKTKTKGYLPPIVRAIQLHFMLAYDHPFVDGNGRTARALFYWSMLHQGYSLAEFLSISRVIKRAQGQYKKAFLHAETDDNDTTYFVIHQLKVIVQAIEELRQYLDRKTQEIAEVESRMRSGRHLNHRQRALVAHALRHPGFVYTFESHRASHDVVFATARADVLELANLGLLEEAPKIVRARAFRAPKNVTERLGKL